MHDLPHAHKKTREKSKACLNLKVVFVRHKSPHKFEKAKNKNKEINGIR